MPKASDVTSRDAAPAPIAEQFPITDGLVTLPERPRLGIEIEMDVLETCRVWPADRREVQI